VFINTLSSVKVVLTKPSASATASLFLYQGRLFECVVMLSSLVSLFPFHNNIIQHEHVDMLARHTIHLHYRAWPCGFLVKREKLLECL
jgi:uncharacterized protein involved in tolerance to divalent cations